MLPFFCFLESCFPPISIPNHPFKWTAIIYHAKTNIQQFNFDDACRFLLAKVILQPEMKVDGSGCWLEEVIFHALVSSRIFFSLLLCIYGRMLLSSLGLRAAVTALKAKSWMQRRGIACRNLTVKTRQKVESPPTVTSSKKCCYSFMQNWKHVYIFMGFLVLGRGDLRVLLRDSLNPCCDQPVGTVSLWSRNVIGQMLSNVSREQSTKTKY